MMPRVGWLALALLAAACHGAVPAPAPAPAPDDQSGTVAARPQLPGDSARAAGRDSLASADSSGADLTREAISIFGDSMARVFADSAARAQADVAAPVAEPSWDLDVRPYETRARVEHFVERYSGPAHDTFEEWLTRGERYDPMIRAKLRAAGLPEDLSYLALIESGYDPDAYSRAAAVGMWQLMASTARSTGLRVDWWVDERRDPVRSTDGAIKFLGWLNDQFGSLYLAAAAYNGGPGRIARGLSRYADDLVGVTKDDAFFTLAEKDYLRAETRDYVPQLIAAALVAKEPARYGLQIPDVPPLAYDSVRVGPLTPLAAVAKASNSSLAEIVDLNSMILRGVTPPKDSFTVRMPVGRADGFGERFAALPKADRSAFRKLVSKKGETLSRLGRRAGVTSHQISIYNPKLRTRKGVLSTGQSVLVPSAAVIAAARSVPDPDIERYGGSSGRVTTHVVRRGETLSGIALHYKTTVATLKRLNGLKKDVIYAGQEIVIRGSRAAPKRRSAKKAHD